MQFENGMKSTDNWSGKESHYNTSKSRIFNTLDDKFAKKGTVEETNMQSHHQNQKDILNN
jgi:hypothetical protein